MIKNYFIPIILVGGTISGQVLDPRYHTLPEIEAMLDSLDQIEGYDNIFHLETIGFSTQENLPIKAVKISDNANVKEDEARVLFIGQCHAEEILGVEAVIDLMFFLLDPPTAEAQHVNILRQNLEIWIVPTYNPEGLNVVHSGLDATYRKNKHDFSFSGTFPNGTFDYDPSIGNDIDGVDLNRNYDFNWVFGDTFMEPDPTDYAAHYDYYKGTEPWSESEVQAIRNLALENEFLFSIAWHSSRSGRFSEKVYTPWKWDNSKYPPDIFEMISIGDGIANHIIKEDGVENYESKYGTSRKGMAHDWFYSTTGCFQYLIECGTANLQPDSALIEDTIERLMPAQIYLLDRAIGYNEDAGQITGIVRDGSGNALEDVEVIVDERMGGVLTPRKTDEFGRFRRILNPGTYTLHFRKFGYEETIIQATANNSSIYETDVVMNSSIMHDLTLNILGDGWGWEWELWIRYENDSFSGKTELGLGEQTLTLPEGEWNIIIYREVATMPWCRKIILDEDRYYIVDMPDSAFIQSINYPVQTNITWWEYASETWVVEDYRLKSQSGFLYPNSDSTSTPIEIWSPWIDVTGANRLAIVLVHRHEVEWDNDSIIVSLHSNNSELVSWHHTGQVWNTLNKDYIWVNDTLGFDSVRFHLELKVDGTVNYRGWWIGYLNFYAFNDINLGIFEHTGQFNPIQLGSATAAYPNPSSGLIAIDLENWKELVDITAYNLLGQEVYHERLTGLSPQRQTWRYNFQNQRGTPVSSGIYFIRVSGKNREFIRKCVFLKP